MMKRPGYSLAEALVALTLAGLLSALLLGAAAAQVRHARVAAWRVSEAGAVRTAAHILAGELRDISIQDVRASSAESVAVRVFRGTAIPCGVEAGDVIVRFRGDRLPDPRKDSVLALLPAGGERSLRLVHARGAGTAACAVRAGEVTQRWTLSEPADGGLLLLLFETGAFHFATRALRYRAGADGRQPLTAELFQPGTGFTAQATGDIGFRVITRSRGADTFRVRFGHGTSP
jgi:hypothetical protein